MKTNRIAFFFSTSGHSGVDRIVKNLVPALIKRGYQIDLLSVRRHGPHFDKDIEGLRVFDMGTRHTYLACGAVAKYLKRERPLLLFSDKDRVNRTALLAKWLAGVDTPLIFSQGTTVSIDLQYRGLVERLIQRFSMGKLYRFAANVITVAETVADDMAAYTGLPRQAITAVASPYVPQAVFDTKQTVPEHEWFVNKTCPIIVGVGELSARKDFATVIRGFAELRQQQAVRLVILGKGREREALEQLVAQLGVSDDVWFAGFQANPYTYMAHADVFVTASRWEGLPAVICEAMALGCQVVASRCPGHIEALQEGRFGALFDFGDSAGLAVLLSTAIHHPTDSLAVKQAAARYEINAAAGEYLRAFGLPEFYE